MNYITKILIFQLILFEWNACECYTIPEPNFVLLSPKGFQFTIPDEPEMKLFIVHGAVNRKLGVREPGDFSGEKLFPSSNGKWTYQNLDVDLQPKDIIYYWIYVQVRNQSIESEAKNIRIKRKMFENLEQAIIETDDDNESLIGSDKVVIKGLESKFSCARSLTSANGGIACRGKLLFEEIFENDILDVKKWQREIKFGGYDEEFVIYSNRRDNLYIENDKLVIQPTLTIESGYDSLRKYNIDLGKNCTEISNKDRDCKRSAKDFTYLPPITSAKIETRNSFSFRYGLVEIRAKLPKGDWIFPQILLEPKSNFYGYEYESGQIRIAFIHGNEVLDTWEKEPIDGRLLLGGVIVSNSHRNRFMVKSLRSQHLGNDFHTYRLLWTSDNITLRIDGNEYGTISFNDFSRTLDKNYRNLKIKDQWNNQNFAAPFDQEFYLSLGVAVGGINDFPDKSRSLRNIPKPWLNSDVKNEIKFWKEKDDWYPTWVKDDIKMKIDYVRIWAL